MKKILIILMIFCNIFSLNAKRIYFDMGIGRSFVHTNFKGASAVTTIDNTQIRHEPATRHSNNSYIPNSSFRLGYRIYDKLYLLAHYQSIISFEEGVSYKSNAYENNYGITYFNYFEGLTSSFLGFGFLYYLRDDLQVGLTCASTYLSRSIWIRQDDDLLHRPLAEFTSDGIGFDLSVAYEIPLEHFGLLLGGRLYYSFGSRFDDEIKLYTMNSDWNMMSVGLFTKVRF